MCAYIINISDTSTNNDDTMDFDSQMDLDYRANMAVVGRNPFILNDTMMKTKVIPLSLDYNAMQDISIIDAAAVYDFSYFNKSRILVLQNSLYVPAMVNNLILPFILREAGIQVNDVPKIQVENLTIKDHSIY